jgi:hypothetical protein
MQVETEGLHTVCWRLPEACGHARKEEVAQFRGCGACVAITAYFPRSQECKAERQNSVSAEG